MTQPRMDCFETFAAKLEDVYQESLSSATKEAAPEAIVPEGAYAALFQALKGFSDAQGWAIGTLLSSIAITEISSCEELEARLNTLYPENEGEILMSRTTAKKVLGYGVKNEVVAGKACSVYYPIEGTRGKTFYIPHFHHNGKSVNDTFSTLLVRLCISMAEDMGMKDSLRPDLDMDAYLTDAAIGGPYRPPTVVKVDEQGTLDVDDSARLAIYDLTGATRVRLVTEKGEKVYPLNSDMLKVFTAANLVVDPKGAINFGDGITASGPYDPSSFYGGIPDATNETLETVRGLITVDKDKFKERYEFYVAKAPLQAADKSAAEDPASSAEPSLANIKYDHGWKRRSCLEASGATPHLVMGHGATKTIAIGCKYTYREGESEKEEENSCSGAKGDMLEQKAAAALLWLRNRSGSQTSDLESKYPEIHGYFTEIISYIGSGTRRDKLAHFIRSKNKQKAASLTSAAAEAASQFLLPPVTLTGPDGEFEASDVLVLTLALLKWCASLKFLARNGLDSVFYWDA